MKLTEKLDFLQENYMGEWLKAHREAWDEVSDEHPIFCVCRRLCTGLHENHCRKFQNKVISRTVKKLKHLLPSKSKR